MFKQLFVCEILISCPSDIHEEIKIINKVVAQFNDTIGLSINLFVKTLNWSKNVIPQSGNKPQDLINNQIVNRADMTIAIFGNKIGSPTDRYSSGTIEEIDEMIKSDRQVFVYFSDKPIKRSEYNNTEQEKIISFKKMYRDKGIYWMYTSNKQFEDYITSHLNAFLTKEKVEIPNNTTLYEYYEIPWTVDNFTHIIRETKTIDIFASGSNTYYDLFYSIINKYGQSVFDNLSKLRILIRKRNDAEKMRIEEYIYKWKFLFRTIRADMEYRMYNFHPFMMRGIIFDDKIACLGFYYRKNIDNNNLITLWGSNTSLLAFLQYSPMYKYSRELFDYLWEENTKL